MERTLFDLIPQEQPSTDKNFCDWNHETSLEVRRLPIGDNANLIVCVSHYAKQVADWQQSGDSRYATVPKWEQLEVYRNV